jgi:hypothetical protein
MPRRSDKRKGICGRSCRGPQLEGENPRLSSRGSSGDPRDSGLCGCLADRQLVYFVEETGQSKVAFRSVSPRKATMFPDPGGI